MTRGVSSTDTIAAIATPPGRGGIGVVRISGRAVRRIAQGILGEVPRPRYARFGNFLDYEGGIIDQGLALYFPAPRSFTGEDVLELHGHGGPIVMDMLLARVVELGARLALPGEFTERAFINDKIDLSQAEAIADLIDSVSRTAAKSAMRSLQGEFSARIRHVNELVVNLRMFIEAAMDFPEEEIDFLADDKLITSIADIEALLADALRQANQGALLREGITLVIAGRPNAGKSTLMNNLTGTDASIVTAVPGTTRDIVDEYIHLDGIPLKLIDTAGIRASEDEVELEGVKRALRAAAGADQILAVVDISEDANNWQARATTLIDELGAPDKTTVVLNKIDLLNQAVLDRLDTSDAICISAVTGEGMDGLKHRIKALAGFTGAAEGTFMARRRHLDALDRAGRHLRAGKQQLITAAAGELLAEELRLCHESLAEITGEFTTDELLGKIFENFCIGK